MGRCRDEIATGTDGPYLGPERDRVVADLSQAEKDRLRADIRATNILLQGLPRDSCMMNLNISGNTRVKTLMTTTLGFSPADELLDNLTKQVALLAQQYKTQFPQTNNQLRTSSNTQNQATIQNGRVVVQNVQGRRNRVQGNNARGAAVAGNEGSLVHSWVMGENGWVKESPESVICPTGPWGREGGRDAKTARSDWVIRCHDDAILCRKEGVQEVDVAGVVSVEGGRTTREFQRHADRE
ncbi:hypothetical protein Tco_0434414 [Tanacetum coccineum]